MKISGGEGQNMARQSFRRARVHESQYLGDEGHQLPHVVLLADVKADNVLVAEHVDLRRSSTNQPVLSRQRSNSVDLHPAIRRCLLLDDANLPSPKKWR